MQGAEQKTLTLHPPSTFPPPRSSYREYKGSPPSSPIYLQRNHGGSLRKENDGTYAPGPPNTVRCLYPYLPTFDVSPFPFFSSLQANPGFEWYYNGLSESERARISSQSVCLFVCFIPTSPSILWGAKLYSLDYVGFVSMVYYLERIRMAEPQPAILHSKVHSPKLAESC